MPTKREAGSDGSEVARKRAPRQDPVSCQICRAKKLKCDRKQPCSNCITRRVPCIFSTGVVDRTQPANPTSERTNPEAVDNPLHPVVQRSQESSEQQMTADWLETIVMAQRLTGRLPTTLEEKPGFPEEQMIARTQSYIQHAIAPGQTPTGNPAAAAELTSFLPRESQALSLFRYYLDHIDCTWLVTVPSRTQAQINHIYQCMHDNSPVDPNHLALLFSILAAASYFQSESPGNLPESPDYGEARSHKFISLVGAALIQSSYMTCPTVEGLQATIIVAHGGPTANNDPSICSLFAHGTMVGLAKQLGLHCIDSPRYKEERKTNGFDPVDVELRRRLWWHLVAYDWLLGFMSGPQERTYLINPRHMNAKLPANIDDDDIGKYEDGHSLPESVPTRMSYALQRIKLARLCREIVDSTADEYFQWLEVSYDKIMELDRKLNQGYKELPDFFRLDTGSRRRYAQLYRDRPSIAWQRLMIQLGFHFRVCRLHRDYFIRGARNAKYSYSHVVCLQSARRVIEIKRIMDNDGVGSTPNSAVVWGVIHHVFVATVILLMDMCFNWDDILADKRREEILDACRMLDKAQRISSLVRDGINAMMDVLQKYWRPGRSAHQTGTMHSGAASDRNGSAATVETIASSPLPARDATGIQAPAGEGVAASASFPANETSTIDGADRGLEGIWTEFLNSGADFGPDPHDWIGLFTELTDVTKPYE